ncbi:MAG: D-ribose pyranase [Spirochaetaceae bacterium]|jgi:D-ribose pyranase|nr:D-ribose pyranase [Spirochaetaceae bacterium]
MKRTFLLNSGLSLIISELGHTEALCIADCGLPVPSGVRRVDLALSPGIPSFLETLRAALSEMCVERALFAEELKRNSAFLDAASALIKKENPKAVIEFAPHEAFKKQCSAARAVIRSGEQTPYANVLLYSGVTF